MLYLQLEKKTFFTLHFSSVKTGYMASTPFFPHKHTSIICVHMKLHYIGINIIQLH